MLIDTSLVKVNDLVDKFIIPLQSKLILLSISCSDCLLLQFVIIRYVHRLFKKDRLINPSRGKPFQLISLGSICALSILIGFSISQQIYSNYYDTLVSILIIIIHYGIGAFFIVWLALLFFSWYRSSRNLIVFLYFISMLIISFNLIMTAAWASAKLSPPHLIGEYVGSSGEMSPGRFQVLDFIYRVSSFLSFFSIWITTAILMNNYRARVVDAMVYWILLSIPRYARGPLGKTRQ